MKQLLRFLLALALATIAVSQQTCDSGKVFQTCGSACPLSCDPNQPLFCTFQCVAGCFCPPGLAELGVGCVAPADCLAATTPPPPPPPPTVPVCSNGMVYGTCGTACPLTCENRNDPPRPCPLICVQGCSCPPGMAEHEGSCYNPDECPAVATTPSTPPTPTCTNGMIFNDCGTACPLTCDEPNPRPCIRICEQGCFCPNGLLQYDGGCVDQSDCPAATTPPPPPPPTVPVCSNGMVYGTCGTACPLTCENRNDPPRPCPLICVQGCSCPFGMAEHEGSCYNPDECPAVVTPTPPPVCFNGMVFGSCGTTCPLTCEHPEPRTCIETCVEGCFCPSGLLLHLGQCVERQNCPAVVTPTPPPACFNGMVFGSCGTTCPLTCEHPEPRTCIETCVEGCFCPSGLLLHLGQCVERQNCPVIGTPPPPACFNGMVFGSCGTTCPLTCEHPEPRTCIETCVEGCFCPTGLLLHLGQCVTREECPSVTTTEVVVTPPPTPPTPTCTNGMIFNSCGTACPLTCDQPDPRPCIRICVQGCFCPNGLLQNDGGCVDQSDCPATPLPPTCPDGEEYRECGPVCPPTCAGLNACFSLRCSAGCFCPEGQMEHEGRCVSECPSNTPAPTQIEPLDPCDSSHIACLPHEYCVVNNTTGRGMCVSYCRDANCLADQVCEVLTSGCGPEDDYCSRYPQCKDAPYVLCGQDAFLACDSEWTFCLQQNKTRRATCVSDCFSRNGNCDDDDICITTVEGGRPRLHCVDTDDLSSDCPAGQMMDTSDCSSPCHETCEDVVRGTPTACAAVCAEPSCICPRGLVRFRDRCVDPRLCYVLLTYPPRINPLPIVDPNTVLLSLYSSDMDREQFSTRRYSLTSNIQNTLARNGHDDVDVSFHGVFDDNDQLQIVIQLSGSSISRASIAGLIRILSQNSDNLGIPVQRFGTVEVVYVNEDPDLSEDAIIGIAVSSGVAGIAVVVAWIAVVTCCCVLKGRRRTPPPSYACVQGEKVNTNMFLQEKDLSTDPEKGKLVLESLCD